MNKLTSFSKYVLLSIACILNELPNQLLAQLPDYLPSNGLVAWYPFNGNANDESGNENNGVVNGATLAPDRFGLANNAYSFNGSSTSIKAISNNLPVGNSSSTMSIWFSAASLPCGSSKAMLTYGNWSCNQARYIGFRGGCAGNLLTYAQYCNDINASYSYELNTWYHFVATSDANTIKLYINAQLVGTYTLTDANTSNGNIAIGSIPGASNGDYFDGLLDDAAIWNRVLTQEEITALYSSTSVNSGGNNSAGILTNPIDGNTFCSGEGVVTPFPLSSNATIQICFSASHTYVSDLAFYLVGPPSCGSPTIVLSPNPGSSCNGGNNVVNLCFSNVTSNPFDVCTAVTPLSGTYGAYSSGTAIDWSPIFGCDANEPGWAVQIYDCVSIDEGSLNDATLTFSDEDGSGNTISSSYSTPVGFNSPINDNSCSPATASIFQVETIGGTGTTVTFNSSGSFNPGNRFIVQLSDSLGTFNGSLINIGEITATEPAPITVTFPPRYYTSNLYRLRVIGTNPPTLGSDNGTNFTINPLPDVRLGSDTTICAGTTITLNATSSGSNYVWNTGATTSSIQVSQAGQYWVAATNSCGTTRDTINVGVLQAPTVNLGPDRLICLNSSTVLVADSGAYNYLWSTGAITRAITAVLPGTYTVTVSNACGSATDNIAISNIPAATVNLGVDRGLCAGESVVLNAGNAGATYLWSNGSTAQTITVTTPGTYSVNVTTACGIVSDQITFYNGAFQVNAGADRTICNGESVQLTATGANGYSWNTGQTTSSITVSPTTTTTYTVSATNIYNCTSTDAVVVNVNALPAATATLIGPSTYCANQPSVLQANSGAGLSYQWQQNGSNVTGATLASFSPTASGIYTVRVTNAQNCSATSAVQAITVLTVPSADITPSGNVTLCSGSSVTLQANVGDGLLYAWNSNGSALSSANASSLLATQSGSYTVQVTAANGCSATSQATQIIVNETPTISISANGPVSLCTGGSVQLTATASAGATIQWEKDGVDISAANGTTLSVNAAGIYTARAASASNCGSSSGAIIVTISTSILPVFDIDSIYCSGAEIPFLPTISANGIEGSWTPAINNVATTVYAFTPSTTNSCASNQTLTIFIDESPAVYVDWVNATCQSECDGSAVAIATGGLPPYSYSWNTGASTNQIFNLCSGNYEVTVTDARGCQSKDFMPVSGKFQITGIRVDACGLSTQEGWNEMVFVQTGNEPLNISNLSVIWPSNMFTNWNCNNDELISNVNSTIIGNGLMLQVPSSGFIPPNSNLVIFTSNLTDANFDSFKQLNDTIYAVFQCSQNPAGHFGNNGQTGSRTLIMNWGNGISDQVTYECSQLVNISGTTGGSSLTQNGSTVLFSSSGQPFYLNLGCDAPYATQNSIAQITAPGEIFPEFNLPIELCRDSEISAFPTTSLNGINGTWSDVVNNLYTSTYYFIPDSNQCAVGISHELIILENQLYYVDSDWDGYGSPDITISTCTGIPDGYVSNDSDCNDNDAVIFIGAVCSDNDACTTNDIIQSDCTCAGTFADADNDGTCDANDLCAGPEAGTACDDADACTINDLIQSDCTCAGTFADSDNDGTCDANDFCEGPEVGTVCDDNNACTVNDLIQSDCTCVGTFADGDNDGTCDANDLCEGPEAGTACDDNDACTVNDVIQSDCTCAGSFADADGDGTCDANDNCAGQDAGLACDDNNLCTVNDVVNQDCVCEGVPVEIIEPQAIRASAKNICSGEVVTLSVEGDLGSNTTWKWYSGSCGGNLVGTGASISVTPTTTTSYHVRAEGGECGNSDCLSTTIQVILPPSIPQGIVLPAQVCRNSYIIISVLNPIEGMSYTWDLPNGWIITDGQGTATIRVLTNQNNGQIRVYASNACGISKRYLRSVSPLNCNGLGYNNGRSMRVNLWPNPASELVRFAHGDVLPERLVIYDTMGRVVYEGAWIAELDVSNLSGGIYFVRATGGGESVVTRMEIAR